MFNKENNRKGKIIVFLLCLLCFPNAVLLAQIDVLLLSSYKVPLDKRGAYIASVLVPVADTRGKIKISRDTAALFRLNKKGEIFLRRKKQVLANDGIHAYGLLLDIEGKSYAVELVKDEFLKNKVIAHRGAWRKQGVMQNSIRSFQQAALLGCAGSEFDVWLSKDRVVVLSHDPHIGGLAVEESTAKELYAATAKGGDPVPTLVDFITVAKQQNRTKMVLEIKASPTGRSQELADSVVAVVHRLHAQGYVEYISFDYAVLQRIMKLDPSAHTAYLYGNKSVEELKSDGIMGLDYDFYHYRNDPGLVERAKHAGLSTNVWTVNSEEDLRTFMKSGVDWITTDEPELLLQLINQQKSTDTRYE
ncbi:glycerophosphodiester phosphodiesterase [Sphingobacterium sp. LRF_L2]|uniref:glycerophosphodiester phosphodiesterase n=1 Tax=Sphingobacterium sp. LRF_L2 TaxID=3369421 RepID=UPI003F630721